MGLLQKAYETYEAHAHLAGAIPKENEAPLAPCSHTVKNIDLEITLNQDGQFVRAAAVDKSDVRTIIPTTGASEGRSSTKFTPYPLCDQLQYLAPYDPNRHAPYVEGLRRWVHSPFSHPMLPPILQYIEGETILPDLLSSGLIQLDGKDLPKKPKLMVRWRVVGLGLTDEACWKNQELFQAFMHYDQSIKERQEAGLCMITGQMTPLERNHPKGIVSLHRNAKLISANDDSGCTYRGRFSTADQALTIGSMASRKAHNALHWLLENQGASFGRRAFLCWEPSGVPLPKPYNPYLSVEKTETLSTPLDYQQRLRETVNGHISSLPSDSTQAIIAAFDAATAGRLALTYYNELRASDFLERLYHWDRLCCWPNGRFGIQAPSLFQIVSYTFGTQREERGKFSMKADDRVVRQQLQRLLACRIDQAPMPYDIVRQLAQNASHLMIYEEPIRQTLLFITCAVLRKYYKEEWSMALEPQKPDRSYQFGRLLAILETAERDTYGKEESRETNAIRMQTIFSRRPFYAFHMLSEQVKTAYYPRLAPGFRIRYERLIAEILEIISQFPEQDWDRPLEPTYLMGYYLQKADLYAKKDQNREETEHGSARE